MTRAGIALLVEGEDRIHLCREKHVPAILRRPGVVPQLTQKPR